MSRHLIADGQIFQSPALHRGMGKYSLELLAALEKVDKEGGYESITVIVSKQLIGQPEAEKILRERLKRTELVWLDLKPNVIGNSANITYNRRVIDAYINDRLQQPNTQVDYCILSLLQGEICPVFPTARQVTKLLLFYDLIPLMFHKIYLDNPITRQEYLAKLAEMLRADHYVTISKTSANDLAVFLGIESERISSIDGGPINHGSMAAKKLKVKKPFILMPTGNDLRKNNLRAIQGFEEFNKQHDHSYSLVITSFFKDHELEALGKLSKNLVFTGNISGEELAYLYQQTQALLFPSEYEGLGLPILEAIETSKPIACSDIAVFREMSKTAFSYFDPSLSSDITRALTQAVNQPAIDATEYARIIAEYTWEKSAAKYFGALTRVNTPSAIAKPKVLVFGADPSCSQSGKLMQLLHAETIRWCEPAYRIPYDPQTSEERIHYLPYIARVDNIADDLPVNVDEDIPVVYHLDNEALCAKVLFTALAHPGVVILHSLDLTKPWVALERSGYIDASRAQLEKQLNETFETSGCRHLSSVLANQRAVVVFSDYAHKIVTSLLKKMKCTTLVVKAQLPLAGLVYDEILPTKRNFILETSQTDKVTIERPPDYIVQQHVPSTDYESFNAVSWAKFFVDTAGASLLPIFEALRSGTPTVTINKQLSLEANPTQGLASLIPKGSLDGILQELGLLDQPLYAKTSRGAERTIHTSHRPQDFLEQLAGVLTDTKEAAS